MSLHFDGQRSFASSYPPPSGLRSVADPISSLSLSSFGVEFWLYSDPISIDPLIGNYYSWILGSGWNNSHSFSFGVFANATQNTIVFTWGPGSHHLISSPFPQVIKR